MDQRKVTRQGEELTMNLSQYRWAGQPDLFPPVVLTTALSTLSRVINFHIFVLYFTNLDKKYWASFNYRSLRFFLKPDMEIHISGSLPLRLLVCLSSVTQKKRTFLIGLDFRSKEKPGYLFGTKWSSKW